NLNENKLDVPIVSIAIYDNHIEKNGWTTLSLMTSDVVPDKYQAYWAGFLETNITYELTNASFENSVAGDMVYTISSGVNLLILGLCPEPLTPQCKKLKAYLSENMEYVIMQYLTLGGNDEFWYQVGLQMWQLKGMSDAYRHIFVSDASTLTDDYLLSLKDDVLGVYLLQLSGDLSEILKALALPELINHVNQFGVPTVSSPSCSALIKLIRGDVYLSHVTWSPYSMMLRVLKHYNFPWKVNGKDKKKIPGYAITFSSYPSVISSVDDFYITSAKLVSHEYKLLLKKAMRARSCVIRFILCFLSTKVSIETTIGNSNEELWRIVRNGASNSVLEPFRVTVANRMAQNGAEWVSYFKYQNSGTGLVFDADVTDVLKRQTYWASYNLPLMCPALFCSNYPTAQMNMLATSGPTYDNVPPFQWSKIPVKVPTPRMHPDKWMFTPIVTDFTEYLGRTLVPKCPKLISVF
ncbi:uncharacterized protein DEA37_0010205, partial [Paragonimus westermani]